MSESTDVELLHRAWKAMSGVGDLSVLEAALDPEAQWLGVEDGQLCENRKMILTVIRRNLHSGLVGRIEETVEVGGRIVMEREVPEVFARCGKLIAERRAAPTDDLTSVLVHAELDGERLEDHEIVMGSYC